MLPRLQKEPGEKLFLCLPLLSTFPLMSLDFENYNLVIAHSFLEEDNFYAKKFMALRVYAKKKVNIHGAF